MRGVSAGWFERLCATLRRRDRRRVLRRALIKAQDHRNACYAAYGAAKARADTRTEHHAHAAYTKATNAVVGIEIALAGLR